MKINTKQLLKITSEKVGEIISYEKINKGEVNETFLINTNSGNYILRYKDFDYSWGSDQKTISELLQGGGIKQSKVIYFANNPTEEYCIEIQEHIEGTPADDAIKDGVLRLEEYYHSIGTILSTVHSIKLSSYGYLNQANIENKDFLIYLTKQLQENIANINEYQNDFKVSDDVVLEYVERTIKQLDMRIESNLIHSDPSPDNAILTNSDELILIDWDDAKAECWVRDIAWLTFYSDYNDDEYIISDKQQMVLDNFFEGYGGIPIHEDKFMELQKLYHIFLSIQLLDYYMTETQNIKWTNKCKKRLQSILPTSIEEVLISKI